MVIGMMRCGWNAAKVGRVSNITSRRVEMVALLEGGGESEKKKGAGRPRKSSKRTDARLVLAAKRNRF